MPLKTNSENLVDAISINFSEDGLWLLNLSLAIVMYSVVGNLGYRIRFGISLLLA